MLRMHAVAAGAVVLCMERIACGLEAPTFSLDPGIVAEERVTSRPQTLPAVRLTLYWENDGGFAKPFYPQDRHYTAGAGAALTWRAPWVDAMLSHVPSFFEEFDTRQSRYAMGIVGALTIFTPEDIGNRDKIPSDRPYAGWTYGGVFFQRSRPAVSNNEYWFTDAYTDTGAVFDPSRYAAYESLELDVGLVGPSSLAQNAQEMIHHAYDFIYPRGWNHQINDEPEFSLKYNRRWRSPYMLLTENGTGFDVLPELGVTAGTLADELRAGAVFRFGCMYPADFGPGELSNPADFTIPADTRVPLTYYVFARPYGRLVARNTLLQGDVFSTRDPVTVNPEPAVFDIQAGVVVRFFNVVELAYMTTWQSPEFEHQHGWDAWSSLQLTFAWTF